MSFIEKARLINSKEITLSLIGISLLPFAKLKSKHWWCRGFRWLIVGLVISTFILLVLVQMENANPKESLPSYFLIENLIIIIGSVIITILSGLRSSINGLKIHNNS
jgi:hypothetical protein